MDSSSCLSFVPGWEWLEGDAFKPDEIRFLMQAASILSFEAQASGETHIVDERAWAYDVSTRLAEVFGTSDPGITKATEFILSRLGVPGRELLRTQFSIQVTTRSCDHLA